MKSPPDTRRRILEAAITVFARRGYHDATVDEIVAECASSKGAFYFHFPGKEALFVELVESFAADLAARVEEAVRGASGTRARVESAMRAALSFVAEYPDLARVFLVESVGANRQLEQKRRDLHRRFARLIEGYLRIMRERHPAVVPYDARLSSLSILGAINEVLVDALSGASSLHEGPSGPADLESLEPELTALVLRAIGWVALP